MNDLHYYLELPYTVIIRRDEDGDYVARIDELPGCMAHGETQAEALEALDEAMELWITDCLESGDPVPEPTIEESLPSGKWVQRVPKTLHKKLVSLAKRENVSLNQLVASILAEAVGVRRDAQPGHLLHRHVLSTWRSVVDACFTERCLSVAGSQHTVPWTYFGSNIENLTSMALISLSWPCGYTGAATTSPRTGVTLDLSPKTVQPQHKGVILNG